MEMKISTYDFLNKFILGFAFVGVLLLSYFNDVNLILQELGEINNNATIVTIFSFSALAVVYEIGIIINRLGSLLEEVLKYFNLIPFNRDYKRFNDKKREYPIMTTLSREYASSRNSIILFVLISIIVFIKFCWFGFIPLGIMLLFYFSCRKYAKKICALME